MLIRPLDKAVINVVACNHRFHIRIRQDEARNTRPVRHVIALEPMVPDDQMAVPMQHHCRAKPLEPIIPDLCIV